MSDRYDEMAAAWTPKVGREGAARLAEKFRRIAAEERVAALTEALAAIDAAFTPVCEMCHGTGEREAVSFVDSRRQISRPCNHCHGRKRMRYSGIDIAVDAIRALTLQ